MAIHKNIGRMQVIEAAIEAIVKTMNADRKQAFRDNLTALVNQRLAEIDEEITEEREEAQIGLSIPRLEIGSAPRPAEEIECEIAELNEHLHRLTARCS